METLTKEIQWLDLAKELGKDFEKRASDYDRDAAFVEKNYEQLKEYGFLSATIPAELGGGGISHSEMCNVLRIFGQHCSSTALALSMHQHLIAATIWKYKQGQGGEDVLKKVVQKNLVLVSTGARDWLESNGEMQKTERGYLVSAQKHFASQSSGGDVLVTSAPFEDPEDGWQVLHFSVPFTAEGLKVMDNWYTMGMRGTGSNTVILDNVFVPESAIVQKRQRGTFNPFWSMVLTVAMPMIMSVYVGIAERAARIAIEQIKKREVQKDHITFMIGEMNNELTSAQVQWKDMVSICNNLDFKPSDEKASSILTRKTNVVKSCINTVAKAMEIVGAQSFFVSLGLERLFRDVQASKYHPLTEKDQQLFTGEFLLRD